MNYDAYSEEMNFPVYLMVDGQAVELEPNLLLHLWLNASLEPLLHVKLVGEAGLLRGYPTQLTVSGLKIEAYEAGKDPSEYVERPPRFEYRDAEGKTVFRPYVFPEEFVRWSEIEEITLLCFCFKRESPLKCNAIASSVQGAPFEVSSATVITLSAVNGRIEFADGLVAYSEERERTFFGRVLKLGEQEISYASDKNSKFKIQPPALVLTNNRSVYINPTFGPKEKTWDERTPYKSQS